MWGALAKVGGTILAGLGLDWALNSYEENQAQQEQQAKNINIGKVIVGASAIYLGYVMMKKIKW